MTLLRFHIPGQPIAKGRARISTWGGFARAYTPEKTVAYEGLVASRGSDAMDGQAPFDGPLRVEVVATFAIPASWSKRKRAAAIEGTAWHTSRPDGDNIAKACFDALNKIVWTDDSRIASCEVAKVYGVVPGVQVTVMAL